MNYKQAQEYRDLYDKKVHHQKGIIKSNPFTVDYLVIAPKNHTNKKEILYEIFKGPDNEGALKNLGLLNENLDIYIFGGDDINKNDMKLRMTLDAYLSTSNQLPPDNN